MIDSINKMMIEFNKTGRVAGYKMFNSGHINTTVLVIVDEGDKHGKYVLQRINTNVFKNPEGVMENISNVTNYIRRKMENSGIDSKNRVLKFNKANNGKYFAIDSNGGYWRLYDYVEDSVTFDAADDYVLYETGRAFGEFQTQLKDYPSKSLFDTIPNFHNTPKRYERFKEVLSVDSLGRAPYVYNEIMQYLSLEKLTSQMQAMLDAGKLPLRVTHNDTKCNNVLFDENTHKHLCVIDLDTVMPGLVGFDFGDAVRFASNTEAEDCTDLSAVKVDLGKFKAFTQGFINSVGNSLTREEINTLVLGAITMTTECGLRFLTDYIDGDNYFKIDYPGHNLDRARCQLKLAQEMILNRKYMEKIVGQCIEQSINNNSADSENENI